MSKNTQVLEIEGRIECFAFTLILMLCFASSACLAGTSLDLRTDGRIVAGGSAEWVKAVAARPAIGGPLSKLSDELKTILSNRDFVAIVLPENPARSPASGNHRERLGIGLLLASETLPDDQFVSQDDFDILRTYATGEERKRINKAVVKYKKARRAGNSSDVAAAIAELKLSVPDKSSDLAAYTGFLLADMRPDPEKDGFVNMMVSAYEVQTEKAILPVFKPLFKDVYGGEDSTYSQYLAIQVAGTGPDTLDSKCVPFRYTPGGGLTKVWAGTSLFVIPPDNLKPYALKDGSIGQEGLKNYLATGNKGTDSPVLHLLTYR